MVSNVTLQLLYYFTRLLKTVNLWLIINATTFKTLKKQTSTQSHLLVQRPTHIKKDCSLYQIVSNKYPFKNKNYTGTCSKLQILRTRNRNFPQTRNETLLRLYDICGWKFLDYTDEYSKQSVFLCLTIFF